MNKYTSIMVEKKRIFGFAIMRAIAILLVLYGHGMVFFYPYINQIFANVTFSQTGYWGVELFFVLSGFLIGTIFLKSFYNSEKFWKEAIRFWKRRWYRTLPNYYFTLILLIVIAYLSHSLSGWRTIIPFFFFLQNMFANAGSFWGVSWSLSVEEWFYLALPVLTWIFYRTLFKKPKDKISLWVIVFVIIVCNLLRMISFINNVPSKQIEYLVPFRLDAIMYGVLFAWLYLKNRLRVDSARTRLLKSSLLLFILLIFIKLKFVLIAQPVQWAEYLILSLTPLCFSMLIPFFKNIKYIMNNKILIHSVTHISKISYSLYLIHMLLLNYFQKIMIIDNLLRGLGAFLLFLLCVVIIASIQYEYLEKPILKWRDKKIEV